MGPILYSQAQQTLRYRMDGGRMGCKSQLFTISGYRGGFFMWYGEMCVLLYDLCDVLDLVDEFHLCHPPVVLEAPY